MSLAGRARSSREILGKHHLQTEWRIGDEAMGATGDLAGADGVSAAGLERVIVASAAAPAKERRASRRERERGMRFLSTRAPGWQACEALAAYFPAGPRPPWPRRFPEGTSLNR